MDGLEYVDLEALVGRGLTRAEAEELGRRIAEGPTCADERDRWAYISRVCLSPGHPLSAHEYLFRSVYRDWDAQKGPPPAWLPPEDIRRGSNLGRFLDGAGFDAEGDSPRWALADRAGFWGAMSGRWASASRDLRPRLSSRVRGPGGRAGSRTRC